MNKLIKFFVVSILLSFTSFSFSDHHMPNYSVMESFQCQLNDGKGMDDVAKVDAAWNKWMQAGNVSVAYNSWRMVPVFQNKKDFDFTHGWIGFASNYEDMGTIQDEWVAGGEKLQAKFDAVEDCTGVHAMNYVYLVRSADEGFQDGFMTVSGCTLSEGATNEAFFAADAKWNAYLDEGNFSNAIQMRWLPGSGTGIDYPYDFLNVSVVPSFKEWGQNVDKLVTGGGAYSQSLYGELASCDTTRIYRTTYVGGYNPE